MVMLAFSLFFFLIFYFFIFQVTARGFGPLLQFAYTAKLLLSKENIQEVIQCAEFLRMHNLEDSCFRFLQTQLLNNEDGLFLCKKDTSCQRVHNETFNCEEETMESETSKISCPKERMHHEPFNFGSGENATDRNEVILPNSNMQRDYKESLDKDPVIRYPHKKYQLACTKNVYNTSHSTSGFTSTYNEHNAEIGLKSGLPIGQIKSEPQDDDNEEESVTLCLSGDDSDIRDKEGDIEMVRKQPDPVNIDDPKCVSSPSSLGTLFSGTTGGEFMDSPGTSHQRFVRSPPCPVEKETTQDDHKTEYIPFTGNYDLSSEPHKDSSNFLMASPLQGSGSDLTPKHEMELDRRSVIFSSSACDQISTPVQSYSGMSCLDKEFSEHVPKGLWAGASQSLPSSHTFPHSGLVADPMPGRLRPNTSCPVPIKVCPRSPPLDTRTRTSSSCSSYSYAEDGSGGSPCSLPLCEFSSSPCSQGPRFPPTDHQEACSIVDSLYNQVRPQIKCEQSYGTNSSDESGSFSEADSESCPVQDSGHEVRLFHTFGITCFYVHFKYVYSCYN